MNDLTYVGRGRFLVGVPAQDIPAVSLPTLAGRLGKSVSETRAWLLSTGLYVQKRKKE